MKKEDPQKNKNNTDTEEETTDSYFQNYIRPIDLKLANLEKIGASLLVIGYLGYIYASNIDILEIQDINNTGQIPEVVLVNAQKIVYLGYIILAIVAGNKINEKILRINLNNESIPLSPYYQVFYSYILSVFAHYMRLNGLIAIMNLTLSKEAEEEDESDEESSDSEETEDNTINEYDD